MAARRDAAAPPEAPPASARSFGCNAITRAATRYRVRSSPVTLTRSMIGSPTLFHAASAPSGSSSRYRAVARIREASGSQDRESARDVRLRPLRATPISVRGCPRVRATAPRTRGTQRPRARAAAGRTRVHRCLTAARPRPPSHCTAHQLRPRHCRACAVSGVRELSDRWHVRRRRRGDKGPVSRRRPRVGKLLLIEETEGSTSGIVNDHPAVGPADDDDVVETSGTVLNQGNRGTRSRELRLHEETHRRGRTGACQPRVSSAWSKSCPRIPPAAWSTSALNVSAYTLVAPK